MKQPTVLDKLKELDAQRTALVEEAKKAALEKAEEAIAELKKLGFSYFLGNLEHAARPKGPPRRSMQFVPQETKTIRHTPSDSPCGYCGFKTEPLHDKRSHRSQTKKRPFNDKELEQLGMTRVA